MSTALYTHPVCIEHQPGPGHPESPDRLRAVLDALSADEFDGLDRREAPRATVEMLERAHSPGHVSAILDNVPETGFRALDPDTYLSPASGDAALRAAGGVCAAVDAVAGGDAANAFCAVRPPGHHAESRKAMGFCLFGNVAIGALHARAVHGFERIAVVDFDVHHGNGTEAILSGADGMFFASSHQFPAYPGTGTRSRGDTVINAPLPPGAGSAEFRSVYGETIFPALEMFAPQIIFVSAGFDAHLRDPLCQLELTTDDFAWVSREIASIAASFSGGKVVSSLEGGYDLQALADSAAAHVRVLIAAGEEGS